MVKFEPLGENPNENETANATAGVPAQIPGHVLCVFLCISFELPISTLRGGASVRDNKKM